MASGVNDSVIDSGGVLIVGAGLAGLFTALKLKRPVTVLAAAPLGAGASSVWAQGGIAAALGADDSAELHVADTLTAGAGIVDENIARIIASEAPARIEDLNALGVPFDRDAKGGYVLGREAAHSRHRIVRVGGDRAGAEIMAALVAAVKATPRIRVIEGLIAFQLALEDGRVTGVYAHPLNDRAATVFVRAEATIFALGGVGGLYEVTTNPAQARGQGVGMAARAGAMIADPEFVQFHPTAIDIGRDPAPLATEALRGEGAILVNDLGQRFMLAVHKDAELAPRDVVARGIFREIQAGRKTFLDARQAIGAKFPQAFPTVFEVLHERGDRSAHAAHSGRAGRALSHGRHRGRRTGAHQPRRALGDRRMRLDRRARREPPGVELAARSDRVRRARGRGRQPRDRAGSCIVGGGAARRSSAVVAERARDPSPYDDDECRA